MDTLGRKFALVPHDVTHTRSEAGSPAFEDNFYTSNNNNYGGCVVELIASIDGATEHWGPCPLLSRR